MRLASEIGMLDTEKLEEHLMVFIASNYCLGFILYS
jgi:hypothetical protein